MKFIFSVVQYWAAQIKSPSFSLSGSSVAMIIRPWRKASSASSIVLYVRFIVIMHASVYKGIGNCLQQKNNPDQDGQGIQAQHQTDCGRSLRLPSSIQTIRSVLELHQIMRQSASGLYRRSGIAPCPEDIFIIPLILRIATM